MLEIAVAFSHSGPSPVSGVHRAWMVERKNGKPVELVAMKQIVTLFSDCEAM